MSFLGNLIWLVFGGFFTGLGYIIGGCTTCLTIIGIPFGLQSIKLGIATFAPFGKTPVLRQGNSTFLKLVFDILWLVFFGWEIAIAHLGSAAILAITIVGLPFAMQHLKLVPVALFPFSYDFE